MIIKKISILGSVLFALPVMTYAQFGGVDSFVIGLNTFISSKLVPLVFTVALVTFVYGIYKYFILGGANEMEREKGKQLFLLALIGFVLMVSIWGIVSMIAGDWIGAAPPKLPETPTL